MQGTQTFCIFTICLVKPLLNIFLSYCQSGKRFTLLTGTLHLPSSRAQDRGIYCLSFLPSSRQFHRSHHVPCGLSCCCPGLLLQFGEVWGGLEGFWEAWQGASTSQGASSLHAPSSTADICCVFVLLARPQAEMCPQVSCFH